MAELAKHLEAGTVATFRINSKGKGTRGEETHAEHQEVIATVVRVVNKQPGNPNLVAVNTSDKTISIGGGTEVVRTFGR